MLMLVVGFPVTLRYNHAILLQVLQADIFTVIQLQIKVACSS